MNKKYHAMIMIGILLMVAACSPGAGVTQTMPDGATAQTVDGGQEDEQEIEATPIPTEDTRLKTVRIGVMAYPEYAPWALALNKNEHDDDFSIQLRMVQNEQAAVDELLAGRIDLAVTSDIAFMKLSAKHDNLRLAALQSVYSGFSIMARKGEARTFEEIAAKTENKEEALMTTIKQFKGRYILVPGGNAFHPELEAVLQKGGLDLDSIYIVNMEPEPGARAFLQGSAAFFSDGIKQRLFLEQNGVQNVITASDLGGAILQFGGLFTTSDFLEKNPESIEKTLDIWYEGVEQMKSQPAESNEKMAAWLTEKTGLSYLAEELSLYQDRKILTFPAQEEYSAQVLSEAGEYYWGDRFEFLSNWLTQQGEIESDSFSVNRVVNLK